MSSTQHVSMKVQVDKFNCDYDATRNRCMRGVFLIKSVWHVVNRNVASLFTETRARGDYANATNIAFSPMLLHMEED